MELRLKSYGLLKLDGKTVNRGNSLSDFKINKTEKEKSSRL
jgi:hypothetical protein